MIPVYQKRLETAKQAGGAPVILTVDNFPFYKFSESKSLLQNQKKESLYSAPGLQVGYEIR